MNKRTFSAAVLTMGVASVMVAPASVSATYNHPKDDDNKVCEDVNKSIHIPVETVAWGDKGSVKVLETKNVANGEYTVKVKSMNQESVHPDSDIIVRSNGSEVAVYDVESQAFVEEEADGTLKVTDGKVTVSIRFGKDKVFSGGVKVTLTAVCEPEPEDVCPNVDGIQEEVPEGYEVDEQGNCIVPEEPEDPEEPEEPKEEPKVSSKVTKLPSTGAGSVATIFTATSGLGYAAHRLTSRKRK